MLNNTQMTETMKRIAIAINCTMSWLSDDKKEDLKQIVAMNVMNYQPTEAFPDPIPCIEFLKVIAIRQAYKGKNDIAVKGQRVADREQQEMEEALEELNYDGEESRFSATFRTVSYDQLHEDTGWEPAIPSIEAQIIEHSEQTVRKNMVAVTKSNPFFPGLLAAVEKHFAEGGNMKSFAKINRLSGQTLKNRLQRAVKECNDKNQPFLPLI